MTCELTAWIAMLALDGPARAWEPNGCGCALAATWPRATQITAAISRLQALDPG